MADRNNRIEETGTQLIYTDKRGTKRVIGTKINGVSVPSMGEMLEITSETGCRIDMVMQLAFVALIVALAAFVLGVVLLLFG